MTVDSTDGPRPDADVRGERGAPGDGEEHPWTVTVDGGGTGCRLAAFDASGTRRAEATGGPASLTLGVESAWQAVRGGVGALAETLGRSPDWLPERLFLGLAGALQVGPRERFLALVPDAVQVALVTDGHAQLLGASDGRTGACLAVGTGSVLYWFDATGATASAGGWGFPCGDEGSGAWLGARLLGAYLRHRDAGGARAPVFEALERRIGRDVSSVQRWATTTRSTELASLVPLIAAAADDGDPLASALLDAGADECARLLALAPRDVPIYLVGGLAGLYGGRLPPPFRARLQTPRGTALDGLRRLVADDDTGGARATARAGVPLGGRAESAPDTRTGTPVEARS